LTGRTNKPGDLRAFVAAARQAAHSDNWFAALALALTLPDICAALDRPGKGISKARYAEWWDAYMAHHYVVRPDPDEFPQWEPFTYLPGSDAYLLRCAYLHSGTDELDDRGRAHDRIRFLGSPSSAFGYDANAATLSVGLEQFVEWVCQAVEAWIADRSKDADVQGRLQGLISIVPSSILMRAGPRPI
jgi:hypothetical protein